MTFANVFHILGFQHTKGNVLHKQLLHYSIGSRILSLSYYILLVIFTVMLSEYRYHYSI